MHNHLFSLISSPRSSRAGFTLIELIVVIAVIGILTSITFASLSGARGRGRDSKRITALTEISLALEFYYNKCGRQYPATLAGAAANGCPSGTTLSDFINPIPQNPTGGAYGYAVGASNFTYVVRATLETNDSALQDDLDGTQLGLDCADTAKQYCAGRL